MKAQDHSAACADAIDDVHLPEWAFVVERCAGDIAQESEQRLLVTRFRQSDVVKMILDCEVRVIFPVWRRIREAMLDDALAKAAQMQQTMGKDCARLHEIERFMRQRHARHHCQVSCAIHVIPGGVDWIHWV